MQVKTGAARNNRPLSSLRHSMELEEHLRDMLPREISLKEFLRFQQLIYRESGIWLSEAKTSLLTGRLSKRLRALGLKRFSEYYERVTTDQEERWTMLDVITTNETHFFREPVHFQFLETHVLPAWQAAANAGQRPQTIRVWSAGCSTGQEAYSLAMTLVDRFPASRNWSIEILATDLSRRALAIAEQGVWNGEKAREIPPHYLRAYMFRGIGENEGKIKAAPAIRVIRFMRLNLNDATVSGLGKFDLIFCRNVLIYFDIESRRRAVGRLLRHLSSDGFLFLGHAETLNGICPSLQCIAPTIYTQAENWSREKHAYRK
jgi:chemotaxis protein methyltransferase CheR